MKGWILACAVGVTALAAVPLSSCAAMQTTYMPDGRKGYVVNCSGEALSWGACYQKAGDTCGSRGYDIIAQTGDKGGMIAANRYGLFGGSVITRNLEFACKA